MGLEPQLFHIIRVVANGSHKAKHRHDQCHGQNDHIKHVAGEIAQVNQHSFAQGHEDQAGFEAEVEELMNALHDERLDKVQ